MVPARLGRRGNRRPGAVAAMAYCSDFEHLRDRIRASRHRPARPSATDRSAGSDPCHGPRGLHPGVESCGISESTDRDGARMDRPRWLAQRTRRVRRTPGSAGSADGARSSPHCSLRSHRARSRPSTAGIRCCGGSGGLGCLPAGLAARSGPVCGRGIAPRSRPRRGRAIRNFEPPRRPTITITVVHRCSIRTYATPSRSDGSPRDIRCSGVLRDRHTSSRPRRAHHRPVPSAAHTLIFVPR